MYTDTWIRYRPEGKNPLRGFSLPESGYYCYYGKEKGEMMESEKISKLREIRLETVLEAAGSVRDPKDRHNWRTEVGRVTLTGQKFFNHDAKKGGGGAIDLVMHLQNCGFKEAVGFLESLPAPEDETKIERVERSVVPAPAPENWQQVRRYLVEVRCLDEKIIDELHEVGTVYADKHQNAVFLSENRKGAELRGTGSRNFHGYRGEKGPFVLPGEPEFVAFCESAIDAVSFKLLQRPKYDPTVYSFAGGAKNLIQRYALGLVEKGCRNVFAAFDDDKAGDGFVDCLFEVLPENSHIWLLPEGDHKDWNSELVGRRSGGGG